MEIGPKILEFSSPFTQLSTQYVVLQNTSNARYAFKVKTTAPKLYCVRPNASYIEPGETTEVSKPSPDTQCTDKFLVMTAPVSSDVEVENVSDFWAHVEKTSRASIDSKKIRVRYNISGSTAGDGSNELSGVPASPASPMYHEDLSATAAETNGGLRADLHSRDLKSDKLAAPVSVSSSRAVSASDAHHHALGTDPNLQEALEEAQSKIRALSKELEDQKSIVSSSSDGQSLKSSSTSASNKTALAHQQSGLPLPQAAALVLIAFLIGWFFF